MDLLSHINLVHCRTPTYNDFVYHHDMDFHEFGIIEDKNGNITYRTATSTCNNAYMYICKLTEFPENIRSVIVNQPHKVELFYDLQANGNNYILTPNGSTLMKNIITDYFDTALTKLSVSIEKYRRKLYTTEFIMNEGFEEFRYKLDRLLVKIQDDIPNIYYSTPKS